MAVIDANVLVLNLDFQPLNVCNVRRAVVLLSKEKATVIEHNVHIVTSERLRLDSPSVIRLTDHVKRPRRFLRVTTPARVGSSVIVHQERPTNEDPLHQTHLLANGRLGEPDLSIRHATRGART